MEGDLKMDILKGKRYDIMNVLWEEGRPLSAFEINDIAPELKKAVAVVSEPAVLMQYTIQTAVRMNFLTVRWQNMHRQSVMAVRISM